MTHRLNLGWALLVASLCQTAHSQSNMWEQVNFPSILPQAFEAISARGDLVLAGAYGYIGSSGSALACSTDSGRHWAVTGAFHVFLPGSVHITRSGLMFAIDSDGPFCRSTDQGISWSPCSTLFFANAPTITSGANGFIYVSGSPGVYRSTDSGVTWSPQNNGLTVGDTRLGINQGGTLVAATGSGIFLSTDNAVSWKAISPVSSARQIALNSTGEIFYTDSYQAALFKSQDGGATWMKLIGEVDTHATVLFIDPTSDAIVVAFSGDNGYYLSADDGVSWHFYSTQADANDLCHDGVSTYFLATDLANKKSNSLTGQWQACNTGLPGSLTSVVSIVFTKPGNIFAGTRTGGLYRSTDNGDNFAPVFPGLPYGMLQLASTTNGNLFANDGYLNFYQSTDNGATWAQEGLTVGNLFNFKAGSLSSSGGTVLAGGTNMGNDFKVVRSIDQGATWNVPYEVSYNYNTPGVTVLPIYISGLVLASTVYNRNLPPNSRIYGLIRSTDYGATWKDVAINLPTIPGFGSLGWDSKGNAYAGTTQGVLRSSDGGTSWVSVNGSLPTSDVRCVVVNARDHVYVGTGTSGVFRSTDSGSSWSKQNSGMTDSGVNTLAFDSDGFLFAGTEYAGVFRSTTSTDAISEHPAPLPIAVSLEQNYPNPFNPSTTIRYGLPKRSNVTLTVFNTLGQVVATLVNETQNAGHHDVKFEASGLASGVYFYRLQAGEYVATKKLLILK